MKRLALALAALALGGCETTAQKSARLEKVAQLQERAIRRAGGSPPGGVSVTRLSRKVKVTATAVLHSSEGTAALVTLHNTSSTPLHNVPIAITVRAASGATLYTNSAAGLARSLFSVALLPARASLTWIDDQVQTTGDPSSVVAKVGEGASAPSHIPVLTVHETGLTEEAGGGGPELEGIVRNTSTIDQNELIVNAVARRAGRIVAAGRAVLPQAPAGASTPFQIYFIGDPRGAKVELTAPASTAG